MFFQTTLRFFVLHNDKYWFWWIKHKHDTYPITIQKLECTDTDICLSRFVPSISFDRALSTLGISLHILLLCTFNTWYIFQFCSICTFSTFIYFLCFVFCTLSTVNKCTCIIDLHFQHFEQMYIHCWLALSALRMFNFISQLFHTKHCTFCTSNVWLKNIGSTLCTSNVFVKNTKCTFCTSNVFVKNTESTFCTSNIFSKNTESTFCTSKVWCKNIESTLCT